MDDSGKAASEYWRRNRRLIALLLAIWFVVSYALGILLAEPLATWHIGRLPAPFWWAQQGSMFVFVLLIFVYAWRMDHLDRQYGVDEDAMDEAVGAENISAESQEAVKEDSP